MNSEVLKVHNTIAKVEKLGFELKSSAFFNLHAFSRFTYYLLLTPYRTVVSPKLLGSHQLNIETNRLQKLFCMCLHFLFMIRAAKELNDMFNSSKKTGSDPLAWFDIGSMIVHSTLMYSFLYICWLKKLGLKYLYTSCHRYSSASCGRFVPKTSKAVLALFVIELVLILLSLEPTNMNFIEYLEYRKQHFMFVNVQVIANMHWTLDWIISSFVLLIEVYVKLLSHAFTFLLPNICCITACQIGTECSEILRKSPNLTFSEVLGFLSDAKQFISNINKVMEVHMLLHVTSGLVHFSSALTIMSQDNMVAKRFVFAIYIGCFVTSLLSAASGTSKLQGFSQYIFKNRNRMGYQNNMEALIVMSEYSSNPIGLRAFKFTITYGFIIKVLSTVVTYSVVVLQFHLSMSTTPPESCICN